MQVQKGPRSRAQYPVNKDPAQQIFVRSIQALISPESALLVAGARWRPTRAGWNSASLPPFLSASKMTRGNARLLRRWGTGLPLLFLSGRWQAWLRCGACLRRGRLRSLRILLAVGLALLASELLLGRKFTYAAAEGLIRGEEPAPAGLPCWADVRAGAARTCNGRGRDISYVLTSALSRARSGVSRRMPTSSHHPVHGESIVTGYGLG